jgi:hypothetical protein
MVTKYVVQIPIAGSVTFEVEAEDKDAALAAAWAQINEGAEGEVEWEYLDSINKGNVCHAPLNEVRVSKVRG